MPKATAAASVSLRMMIMSSEPLYPFAAAVTRASEELTLRRAPLYDSRDGNIPQSEVFIRSRAFPSLHHARASGERTSLHLAAV